MNRTQTVPTPPSESPIWASNIIHTCMGVREGESVLVMVDEALAHVRDALLLEAAKAKPSQMWSYTVPDAVRPFSELPAPLMRMLGEVDVAIALLGAIDVHREGPAFQNAVISSLQYGKVRLAGGAFITNDILEHELSADYEQIAARSHALADWLKGCSRVRVTSALGTDLTFSVEGRAWGWDTGIFRKPGFGNLPSGEVFIAPLEDSAQGTLVLDKSLPGLVIKEPVRLSFEGGRVVHLEGGDEAQFLLSLLSEGERQANGEWCRVIGEFGIGTNPKARLLGNIMTDEKVVGTVHVALGRNDIFGGKNLAPVHLDGVVGQPSVWVDDRLLMEDGNVQANL